MTIGPGRSSFSLPGTTNIRRSGRRRCCCPTAERWICRFRCCQSRRRSRSGQSRGKGARRRAQDQRKRQTPPSGRPLARIRARRRPGLPPTFKRLWRSEEHTSELQSRLHLVCRLLLEKKNNTSDKALFVPSLPPSASTLRYLFITYSFSLYQLILSRATMSSFHSSAARSPSASLALVF